jgi:secreted PhoX family phosphatase
VYIGDKQATGNAIEQAGLNNGKLYGIKADNATPNASLGTIETGAINGNFELNSVEWNQTGAKLQAESNLEGVTNFARPEDGHWADEDTFYFVTTGGTVAGNPNSARLYRMDFEDGFESGGTITMVKDSATLVGKDGATARSFDNMVVADDGTLIIQEDPGNSSYIAKTWRYDPVANTWTQILESDRDRFITGAPNFLTQDEESSGVIDITSILGRNDGKQYFLGDMQAHYAIPGELVEGGQLYVFAVPEPETYGMMLAGLGLMGFAAARRNNKQ